MREIFHHFVIAVIGFSLGGCASLSDGVFNQAGYDPDSAKNQSSENLDEYGMYAPRPNQNGRAPASWNAGDRSPKIDRKWKDAQVGRSGFRVKRTNNNDFFQTPETASLWNRQGQDNFLFSRNPYRNLGDQLILGVQKDLQADISFELHQSTPEPVEDEGMRSPAGDDKKKAEKEEGSAGGSKSEFVDRIPVYVIEHFGTDTFRVKGQKEVVFKGERRRIEVVGLVRKVDISKSDEIKSNKLLDYRVKVLN